MKICTYRKSTSLGQFDRLGIFFNDTTIIDVNLVWRAKAELEGRFNATEYANHWMPSSLSKLIRNYQEDSIKELQETIELFKDMSKDGVLKTKDGGCLSFDLLDDKKIQLACPLNKMNSYRDFYTHEKHVAKGFEKRNEPIPPDWYEIPAYYKCNTAGFIGNDETILWPSYSNKLDYELELGMIVAKDGMNIKSKDAKDHIFGFTILNDISARDIQKKEMAIRLGPAKGKDFCSVMGPVIVTADELGIEPDLLMTATINGEEWSRGQSGDAHYSWSEMIEHVSKEEWLQATDFFGSGTVGTGCGLEIDKWIQPSDIIELEVEKIGTLKNLVGIPNKEI